MITSIGDDIAYILYTSGSTGKPKGVCISNRNALAFVEWAYQTLDATATDRFANHAPFHFDLPVLDLYVAFHAGLRPVSFPMRPLTSLSLLSAFSYKRPSRCDIQSHQCSS